MGGKRGILLDISFGGTPQPQAVVLSPTGPDIRHDPRDPKFPVPKGSVHTVVVTHVLEYLDPTQWYQWWDALHRLMLPYGRAYVSGPYGGDESWGWLSDPTHRIRVVEQTFAWLDPRIPFYELGPRPRPWHPLSIHRVPGPHGTASYNVVLEAQPWPPTPSPASPSPRPSRGKPSGRPTSSRRSKRPATRTAS